VFSTVFVRLLCLVFVREKFSWYYGLRSFSTWWCHTDSTVSPFPAEPHETRYHRLSMMYLRQLQNSATNLTANYTCQIIGEQTMIAPL